ncbi:MAG TPA: hypothetical protein VF263_18055, partial [Longimicrobiaceae bacterium]
IGSLLRRSASFYSLLTLWSPSDQGLLDRLSRDEGYHPDDLEAVVGALVWVSTHRARAKSDARKLKQLLSTLCTWENTAGTLAEALSLDLQETVAAKRVARWNVDIMIEALTNSPDLVNQMARRKEVFRQFWDKMKPPSSFTTRLVLFGGISTALCSDGAAIRFADWLRHNPGSRLYICYETGAALEARAHQLNPDALETLSGLPAEANERLALKEQSARSLRARILEHLDSEDPTAESRIVSIALPEPMTTYIMIADDEVYLTPLLETRSTETLSFALAGRAIQFRRDVTQYIFYYLNAFQRTGDAQRLIEELRSDVSLAEGA